MVRLKGKSQTTTHCQLTEISIPYGAIKSNGFHIIYRCDKIFQFLMVRLKDYGEKKLRWTQQVFQFLMVRLKVTISPFLLSGSRLISIPYGAIKRKSKNAKFSYI